MSIKLILREATLHTLFNLLGLLLVYLGASFVRMDINPAQWPIDTRIGAVFSYFASSMIASLLVFYVTDKADSR